MKFLLVTLALTAQATSAFVVPQQQHLPHASVVSARPAPRESATELYLLGKLWRKLTGGSPKTGWDGPTPMGLIDTDPFPKVEELFPGAKTNPELINYLRAKLTSKGYKLDDKTLCATSLCCDEVNRPLETDLCKVFDTNFNMGGLAGFPWGGVTSFGAMSAHIPDGGNCVIVYGPHVGVDTAGKAGTVERRGKVNGGACCGSAVAASGYVAAVNSGSQEAASFPSDPVDAQQYFVGSLLMPYADRLEKAKDTMVELPYALYAAQTDMMKDIVAAGTPNDAPSSTTSGLTAVLGGVQINTPPGKLDYYLPLNFDLYDKNGKLVESIL